MEATTLTYSKKLWRQLWRDVRHLREYLETSTEAGIFLHGVENDEE